MSRRPLIREVPPTTWFLRHPRYMRYMAREVTSLFIGAYCVLLVVAMQRLSAGPAAWQDFLEALRSPGALVFQLLAMAAAFYHAGTWFNATQKAMPLQIGEEFVKGSYISGAHYLAWGVLSLAVLLVAGVF
jgi:fumarate reductase subunit C